MSWRSSTRPSSLVSSSVIARQHRDVLADRLQQRQRAADQIGAFDQQPAHLPHRRLEAPDLEQHHRLGGLLHLVDGVVHRGDQVLDVAAVERRDEGAAHRGQHLAGDVVGVVLELMDALAVHHRLLAALQHALQRERALRDRLGVTGEQIEKPLLLREKGAKPTQHGMSPPLRSDRAGGLSWDRHIRSLDGKAHRPRHRKAVIHRFVETKTQRNLRLRSNT